MLESVTDEIQDSKTLRQEQKQTPSRNAANWLASNGFFNLISYTNHSHLFSGGTAYSGMDTPTLIVNK